jgi:hypothetical protein
MMPPKSPRQNQLPFLPVAGLAGINFQANVNILFSLLLLGTETKLNLNQSVFLRVDSSSDGWKLQSIKLLDSQPWALQFPNLRTRGGEQAQGPCT